MNLKVKSNIDFGADAFMSENMFNIWYWKDFKFRGWLLLQGTPVWQNEYQFKIAFCASCNFWYYWISYIFLRQQLAY